MNERLLEGYQTKKTVWQEIFQPVVIVGALGYFVDVYDITLFLNVRDPSLRDLGLERIINGGQWYEDLLSWQMAGMLIGGVIFGVFGDRFGRITTLFGSILIYSIANLANAFVYSFWSYAVWRFFAGFGLSGELGGCISLVSETLSQENRGYGTSLVTVIGIFGAVVGGMTAELVTWRMNYIIGGSMGLILLFMRMSVKESGIYLHAKQTIQDTEGSISRGNFFALFTHWKLFKKYLNCIFIAIPTWYMVGILIQRSSSHFGPALNIQGPILANRAVSLNYLGACIGDLASGIMSQQMKSRRRAVNFFLIYTAIGILFFLYLQNGWSNTAFYILVMFMGFGRGYWAVFVTISAEQFGTNLRATVATTVPNFVRGALIPITFIFNSLTPIYFSAVQAASLLGLLVISLSLFSVWSMEETFYKDLDYVEIDETKSHKIVYQSIN